MIAQEVAVGREGRERVVDGSVIGKRDILEREWK